MTHQEQAVWYWILHAPGPGRARTGLALCTLAGIPDGRTLRRIVRNLIMEHRKRIGTCDRGFFLIRTAEEARACTESLRSRARAIYQRAAILEGITAAELMRSEQLELRI